MHEFIDTYVKILIALISFVAPMMVLLLSIFSEAIVNVKDKYETEQKNIRNVIANQVSKRDDYTDDIEKFISKSLRKLRWSKLKNNYRLNLLKPKRQVIKIFSGLALSIGLIMFDMIIKDKSFNMYHHKLSEWLIFSSFFIFIVVITFFMQLGWAIINAKSVILDDKKTPKIFQEKVDGNQK